MRYDYGYIKKACDMGLQTTDAGDEVCREDDGDDELRDFLLFVQDCGIVLPHGMTIIQGVWSHTMSYSDYRPPASVIMEAISEGYVSMYMHIWDNAGLRCRLHGVLDDTLCKSITYKEDRVSKVHMEIRVDGRGATVEVKKRRNPLWDPWEVSGHE